MADDEPDAESSQDGKNWFGRHQQAAWITAGASIVVALISTLVPILGSSGDDKVAGPSVTSGPGPGPVTVTVPVTVPTTVRTTAPPTPPSTRPPTRPPTQPPVPPTVPTTVEPPSSTAGTVLWQGSLLLDTYAKDLDAAPPGPAPDWSSDGDISMLLGQQLSAMNRTLLTRWKRSTSLPGYRDCAATIAAGDIQDQQPLAKSAVLCVQTSAGNIARLRVTALPQNGNGVAYRATFDVIVWSAD
ncbi:hypothetical protein ACQHIV_06820 [Kribbella sp. GL6]|uniref:hypothetical protein n=1 Tax=Kribbella sp. GL6 TaxID=3419765 RepID=UPI003CFBF832